MTTDARALASEGLSWEDIAEAVADSLNNSEGRVSAYYLEYHFNKAGIGVYAMPDHPREALLASQTARQATINERDVWIKQARQAEAEVARLRDALEDYQAPKFVMEALLRDPDAVAQWRASFEKQREALASPAGGEG